VCLRVLQRLESPSPIEGEGTCTEVQEDSSCRGFGGVPQIYTISPKSGGQGVEATVMMQQEAAGSLRVSLKSSF